MGWITTLIIILKAELIRSGIFFVSGPGLGCRIDVLEVAALALGCGGGYDSFLSHVLAKCSKDLNAGTIRFSKCRT